MNYNTLHTKLRTLKKDVIPSQNLSKGISIVIPVYKGKEYIAACLNSLVEQKIVEAKFEVIIVLNGEYSSDYLEIMNSSYIERLDILVLINDRVGASSARNLGMKNAKYSHVTFLDIDDYLSENFIEANYKYISDNTISFSQIYDDTSGEIDTDNSLNKEIIKAQEMNNYNLTDLNKIASITVCKVIPKEILIQQEFREHLRSGEDTVFYCELFVNSRPLLKVVPIEENAIYYRKIRENSVSRKEATYDFLVYQRLEIIEILEQILNKVINPTIVNFVKSKYNAQISFMNRYLIENPSKRDKILQSIECMQLQNFNYSILNRGFGDTLIVSYCFPPYSDTSATVISKRLIQNNKVVDVVSNNMNKIRNKEPSLNNMIKPLVGEKTIVNTQASFSNMFYLNSYVNKAFSTFLNNEDKYRNVYSRAMFPISHIPPLFMKIIKPEIKWIAEFSDPLLIDIESNIRHSDMQNEMFVESLKNGMLGPFSKYVDNNLFNLSELIPFALADNLVFTNNNQLEYMISRFTKKEKEFIREKSVIQEHPTLDKDFYYLEDVKINNDEALINIAYFGNFYSNRNYDNFIKLINTLNKNGKYFFTLHIYTNLDAFTNDDIEFLEDNQIFVYPYLPFGKFLNVTTKYDILLVNDTQVNNQKLNNPYLPSKMSDYLGSGTPILAITEENSILSNMESPQLYKLKSSYFKDETKLKSELDKSSYSKLFDEIFLNDRRKLIKENGNIKIQDIDFDMRLSNNLQINNIGQQEWIVKPLNQKISKNQDYIITIRNTDTKSRSISVNSFYSMKNVIKISFIFSDDNIENFSKGISRLKNEPEVIEIAGQSSLSIKVRYRKSYNSQSFLEAGRLKISNL
ncbi:glycosyltransferase [Lacicoccus qingdaonensis]|uniref:Glycosyltransferase involved in cell wall bisynthesis n=1 Tax=Lacicoccus qingdaonensis TaxID=576118 RepID=A0A1G9IK00_9BACL|nr:glycosyltransferase [Salinicoccus qingdaonensis]SDL25452.1 Glycosyltransferase involved in cell wall bisynthesis [Salinicoccus qingdaonensis]